MASIKLVVFCVGDEEYAVPIEVVKEIIQSGAIRTIPKVDDNVKGIINLRDRLLTILDLADVLGLPSDRREKIIVLETKSIFIGVEVGDVKEVLNIDENDIEPVPTLLEQNKGLIGVVHKDNRMIIILDMSELL